MVTKIFNTKLAITRLM